MNNTKKIKTVIIALVVVSQIVVWTSQASLADFSIGIIGGADGPTSIFLSDKNKPSAIGQQVSETEKDSGGAKDIDEEAEKEKVRQALIKEASEKGLLVLVNKENSVDRDYKPADLTGIKYFASDRSSASRYMREEAAEAFHKLVEDGAMEGIEILMTTAYRSYDFQNTLYSNYVANEGQAAADTFSAKPGQSEHQTGLAVDVSSSSVGYQLTTEFKNVAEGKWLKDNAHKYGFIIRFPEGKEHITGYMYEPWHLRYVGVFVAQEIYEMEITLEEYLLAGPLPPN